jgi:propionate CoA-transferase
MTLTFPRETIYSAASNNSSKAAARRPGMVSKVGLHTFVDPRIEGGKVNKRTEADLVGLTAMDGEEYLFYPTILLDVAMLKGTRADQKGNISREKEALELDVLAIAQAVKNNGGLVIVQVESMCDNGELTPGDVKIPGVLVDAVVVAESEDHKQTWDIFHEPRFHTALKGGSSSSLPVMELDARKVIARRAAMELRQGEAVTLGVGMPDGVLLVATEEGISDRINIQLDSGVIGGIPAKGLNFGAAYYPEAIIPQNNQFDFIHGGGIQTAFLGMAQVNGMGNVNASKFNGQIIGSGGFIDIAQSVKRIVFCGTLNAGGTKLSIEAGRLNIRQEGTFRKFVQNVEQITFSGKRALELGQEILFVTERAVFTLGAEGLVLQEVAPGIDVERDVLSQLECTVEVSDRLREMDERLFLPEPMGLRWE